MYARMTASLKWKAGPRHDASNKEVGVSGKGKRREEMGSSVMSKGFEIDYKPEDVYLPLLGM